MIKILLGIIAILIIVIAINFKEMKTKDEIIKIDNQIIDKRERQVELYGDYIVAILKGEDKKRILMKENVLKAGRKLIEIKKEIEELNK